MKLTIVPGDLVCVFLGSDSPMILRPDVSGKFKVIGICYVHGLSDSSCLLGPLPKPWRVDVGWDSSALPVYNFVNSSTNERTIEDPRLGPLPAEWKRLQSERVRDDPVAFQKFKNINTDEVMDSDPRLLPEALEPRGIPLITFPLL
jgi:hypothetical protein